MGMDYATVEYLLGSTFAWIAKSALTIGRQNWWLSKREARNLGLSFTPRYSNTTYSEPFWIDDLGCWEIASVDMVTDELPTYIANLSIPNSLSEATDGKLWDVICDFGTAEHIADQHAYWANIASSLKSDGRLFVVLPCDAQAGHGLYQFSPEFFYRMRGFNTERCGTYSYTPFGRYEQFRLTGRHQKSFRWPTYVFAELTRTDEDFQLPVQGFTTVTHRKTPPWASTLVELPGMRILERIIRR